MKKLIAALLVCSLITVSFASCNLNSKKKDDSSSKSSSSESADNSDSKSSDKDSSSKSSDKDSSTADVSVAANDSTIDQASTEPATVSTEFTTLKKVRLINLSSVHGLPMTSAVLLSFSLKTAQLALKWTTLQ